MRSLQILRSILMLALSQFKTVEQQPMFLTVRKTGSNILVLAHQEWAKWVCLDSLGKKYSMLSMVRRMTSMRWVSDSLKT